MQCVGRVQRFRRFRRATAFAAGRATAFNLEQNVELVELCVQLPKKPLMLVLHKGDPDWGWRGEGGGLALTRVWPKWPVVPLGVGGV